MSLPLHGVRIVAIEQYGAGPFATQHLDDFGAEVIKIENFREGGDVRRNVGPHFFGEDDSHFFEAFNRNKCSLTLDLNKPEGRDVLLDLVATSDAVFNNLRGDLPVKLGLTYAQLKDVNPAIVCAHLSAYGRTGSRAAWLLGYDSDAGGSGLSVDHRRAGQSARALRSVDHRSDDGHDRRNGSARGSRRSARDRRGTRYRHESLRRRAA